jgi:hypothetical protein
MKSSRIVFDILLGLLLFASVGLAQSAPEKVARGG